MNITSFRTLTHPCSMHEVILFLCTNLHFFHAPCTNSSFSPVLTYPLSMPFPIFLRCFHKIRISNYLQRKINVATLLSKGADNAQKRVQLGATHIRNYQRLAKLRVFYHKWWGNVAEMINLEVSQIHNWHRIMKKVTLIWRQWAVMEIMIKHR